jgi:YVTN family beta-propeller protein
VETNSTGEPYLCQTPGEFARTSSRFHSWVRRFMQNKFYNFASSVTFKTIFSGLAIAACMATPCRLARADTLVILDKAEYKAILMDPATNQAIARLPTQPGPHEVALSPDGRTAYITDFGIFVRGDHPHSEQGNTITVIDIPSQTIKATFNLGNNKAPHGIAVSHDGKYLWLTTDTPPAATEVDAAAGQVLHVWPTGQQGGHLLVASRDEKKLYVSNTNSGTVSVIDRATGSTRTISTGPGTEGIWISPDGREVWVTSRANSKISIIATDKDAVIATLDSGGKGPARVRFTPNGKQVWILNPGSREVTAVDARRRKVLGSTVVAPEVKPIPNPTAIVFSADGRRAYVADPTLKIVTVLDVRSRKILTTFTPGTECEGLAWSSAHASP